MYIKYSRIDPTYSNGNEHRSLESFIQSCRTCILNNTVVNMELQPNDGTRYLIHIIYVEQDLILIAYKERSQYLSINFSIVPEDITVSNNEVTQALIADLVNAIFNIDTLDDDLKVKRYYSFNDYYWDK